MLSDLLEEARDLHSRVYEVMAEEGQRMKKGGMTDEELVDFGFLCREFERLLDDWRKDAKARQEFAGKLICQRLIKDSVNDEEPETTMQGTLARAEIDMKVIARVPEPGSDAFKKLLQSAGVPESAVTSDDGVLKLSFGKLSKMVTSRATSGQPLPPGLETYHKFGAIFTRKQSDG